MDYKRNAAFTSTFTSKYNKEEFDNLSKSSQSSTSSNRSSLTHGSYKSSFTLTTIPSLIIDLPKKDVRLSNKEFSSSLPTFTRNKYDLFGVDGKYIQVDTIFSFS